MVSLQQVASDNTMVVHGRSRKLLPVERDQVDERWPECIADSIDDKLASKYPIIDLDSILSIRHRKRYRGCTAPRFAVYSATRGGTCSLLIARSLAGATVTPQANTPWPIVATNNLTGMQSSWCWDVISSAVAGIATLIIGLWLTGFVTNGGWVTAGLVVTSIAVSVVAAGCVGAFAEKLAPRVLLTAKFRGLLPAPVISTIESSRIVFDKFLIVQEVEDWQSDAQPIDRDPLLIGVKDDVAYLIDTFDCTPLEAYVAREFSQ